MEINQSIQTRLENLGIAALNEMQLAALETIEKEAATVLLAPTGSGKTLAFLLPIFERLDPKKEGVQCLVLTPTRELGLQIQAVWQKMGTDLKSNCCYGGHSTTIEAQNLSQPPALLIGTPGRILEHLARRNFDPRGISILALDEFDKSLSMGFQEQMATIIGQLKGLKKRILISATNKINVPEFTGIQRPVTLNYCRDESLVPSGLTLKMLTAPSVDKHETLFRLLCAIGTEQTLIFCNQRETTENTASYLAEKGLSAAFFHGGLEQLDREKALIGLRNGSIVFLVTSDLIARGLDIPDVRHVVHLELPQKHTDFLHRNGRTARMQADGTAYLIVSKRENLPAFLTEKPTEFELPETPELPPTSPWITLYISGGKKDKLSKIDIVGFLAKKGDLEKDDIGRIELLDFMSFVAVKRRVAALLVKAVEKEKMKGKKYKIGIAK